MVKQTENSRIHLNLNVRSLPVSATIAINEKSAQLVEAGKKIYKLGLGQSPFPVPPCVVSALQENAHQKDYLQVKGLKSLRQTIAQHQCLVYGMECTEDDVLIGPGSKELMFILQLAYYGDILIPSPSWVSYAPQAQIIGRNVHFLPTQIENNWRLTGEELDRFCASDPDHPRILILNYPSNPTGATYPVEELKKIADVARRYSILILSDEIYGKLDHDASHQSIVPMYPEGTIFSSGLSKWCGAGGWRLGVFVFPRQLHWLLKAMTAIASETFTSTSAPIQYAAVRAYEGGEEIDRYLKNSRKILFFLGDHLTYLLRQTGAKVVSPEGGFYLFPDLTSFQDSFFQRGIFDSRVLCQRLLEETGVAILPGVDFGRPLKEFTVRLAYVNFEGREVLSAVDQLGENPVTPEFLKKYCPDTVRGVELLCEWISKKN